MLLRWSAVVGLSAAGFIFNTARAQTPESPGEWRDPSPHVVRFVDVAPGVRIEVLDWGGPGEPLILLAGLNFTAHTFDHIAPRLASGFRVVGITRRGFGASSHPDAGYDVRTLTADVRTVLDSMGIRRAALAGHSMGGEEISWFALHWPDRVSHLIYLDAPMVPPDRLNQVMGQLPPPPPASEAERATVKAYADYIARIAGVEIPEAEVRNTNRVTSDGRVQGPGTPAGILRAIMEGSTPPALGELRTPVLAVRAVPRSPAAAIPWYNQLPGGERDNVAQLFADFVDLLDVGWEPFRDIEHMRWVHIPDANHHVYLSHEEQVVAAIFEFLGR